MIINQLQYVTLDLTLALGRETMTDIIVSIEKI